MNDDVYVGMAKGVLEGALGWADEMEKAIRDHWYGVPFGQKEPTDLEFVMWYEKMMKGNPNWQAATMFTDTGEHDLQRYLRASMRLRQQMMSEMEVA